MLFQFQQRRRNLLLFAKVSYYFSQNLKIIHRDSTEKVRALLKNQLQPCHAARYKVIRKKVEDLRLVDIFREDLCPFLPMRFQRIFTALRNLYSTPGPYETALESDGNTFGDHR